MKTKWKIIYLLECICVECGGIPIILSQKMDLDLTVSIFLLLGFGMMVGGILGFVNNNYVKITDLKTDEKPM